MTLLIAARAADGIAAVSDRKESRRGLPDREVTKFHIDGDGKFYISLAGNGMVAAGLLKKIAARGAGPSAGIAETIRDLAASLYEQYQAHTSVDGILITAELSGFMMYDLHISNGHADLRPNSDTMSVHGDYAAVVVCQSLAGGLETSRMPSNEAAAILHILASKAATAVDSVGGRKEYGFDLVVFTAQGGAKLLERCTAALGTLEIRFHLGRMGRRDGMRAGGRAHG